MTVAYNTIQVYGRLSRFCFAKLNHIVNNQNTSKSNLEEDLQLFSEVLIKLELKQGNKEMRWVWINGKTVSDRAIYPRVKSNVSKGQSLVGWVN